MSLLRFPRANAALCLGVALTLAGCASVQESGRPEQVVQARVEARWAVLLKADFEKAWEYTRPEYRQKVEQANYRNQFGNPGVWKRAEVVKVACPAASQCLATIRLTTQTIAPGFIATLPETTTHYEEEWVREEGRWWYGDIHTFKVQSILSEEPAAQAVEKTDAPAAAAQGQKQPAGAPAH